MERSKESTREPPQIELTDDKRWDKSTKVDPHSYCFHSREHDIYGKKWPSLKIHSQRRNETWEGCILCYANGVRTGISRTLLTPDYSNFGYTLDIVRADSGLSPKANLSFEVGLAEGKGDSTKNEMSLCLWTLPTAVESVEKELVHGDKRLIFEVKADEYGEMFHVLFVKLFWPNIDVINKDFIEDKSGEDESGRDQSGKGKTGKGKLGKDNTSKDKTSKDKTSEDQSSKYNSDKGKRGDIFPAFDYYGIKSSSSSGSTVFSAKDNSTTLLGEAFAKAAAAAVKADGQEILFNTTKQGVPKVDTKRRQLPKIDKVGRMAVIYIRKQGPKGSSGRSMTDDNIAVCLGAIEQANLAAKPSSPIFTHILFFRRF